MRIWFRQGMVIALSLTVFCFSIGGAYIVWTVSSPLGALKSGLLSIFGWVVAFVAGTILFWKAAGRLFGT